MTISILSQTKPVTQFDLARYVKLANQIAVLTAEQSALDQQLTSDLANGAEVEKGIHFAELRTTERRNVSWKKVVIRLKSEGYTNKVLSATKPTSYVKLIVR